MRGVNFRMKVENTNTSRILSIFSKRSPRMTKVKRRKTPSNIHHLYLFTPTYEASWHLKNIRLANEVTGVV